MKSFFTVQTSQYTNVVNGLDLGGKIAGFRTKDFLAKSPAKSITLVDC